MPEGNRYRNPLDQGRRRAARRFKRAGATRDQLRHNTPIRRATGDAGFTALNRTSSQQAGLPTRTSLQKQLNFAISGEGGLPKAVRALPMRVKPNPASPKTTSNDPGRRGPRKTKTKTKSAGLRGRIEGALRRMLSLPRKKGK
jgi:hypothetical protein